MLEKSADEWEVLLNDAHVPAARVRTLTEALQSEQVKSRQLLQRVVGAEQQHANGKEDQFPVAAFTYKHGGPTIDRLPPRMGEHTREVLMELGVSEAEMKHPL